MNARIVDQRSHHRAAVVVTVAGMAAASLFSLLGVGQVVGLGFLAASVAPFLFRDPTSRPAGDVLVKLRPEDVRGISLVRAKVGWSLAIQRKTGPLLFVELENRADARRLAARLRAGRKDVDGVVVEGELPWVAAIHALVGAIAVVVILQQITHWKYGGGLGMAALVTLLTFVRINVTRPGARGLYVRSTAFGAHALLHVHGKRVNLQTFDREPEPPGATLARGDVSTREWLARLDELAAPAGGAYRDAIDEPTLRALVVDKGADIDRRMAAARILKKRVGVSLAREVEDDVVRVRIAAAESEEADVDALEPLFRARSRSSRS